MILTQVTKFDICDGKDIDLIILIKTMIIKLIAKRGGFSKETDKTSNVSLWHFLRTVYISW